jgi:hypothetical protein
VDLLGLGDESDDAAVTLQRACTSAARLLQRRDRKLRSMSTTTTAIDDFLAAICGDHRNQPWTDDAVLDAVVPGWRFSVTGSEAIDGQFRSWFRDPGSLEELRRHTTTTGEVVELTVTWVEDGVPHAACQVHVLELDPAGRIIHDGMWCGGRWPAQLLAQMEAARDAG